MIETVLVKVEPGKEIVLGIGENKLRIPARKPKGNEMYKVNLNGTDVQVVKQDLISMLLTLVGGILFAIKRVEPDESGWVRISAVSIPGLKGLRLKDIIREISRSHLYEMRFINSTIIVGKDEGKVTMHRDIRGVHDSVAGVKYSRDSFPEGVKEMIKKGIVICAFIDAATFDAPQTMIMGMKLMKGNGKGFVPIGGSSNLKRAFCIDTSKVDGETTEERTANIKQIIHDFYHAFGLDEELYTDKEEVKIKAMFKSGLLLLRTGKVLASNRKMNLLVVSGTGEMVRTPEGEEFVSAYEDGLVIRTRPGILSAMLTDSGLNPSKSFQGTLMSPYAKGTFTETYFSVEEAMLNRTALKADVDPDEIDGYINLDGCFGNRALRMRVGEVVTIYANDLMAVQTSMDYHPEARFTGQFMQYVLDSESQLAKDTVKELVTGPMVEVLKNGNPDNITGHGRAQLYGFPKDYYLVEKTSHETSTKAAIKRLDSGSLLGAKCGATLKLIPQQPAVFRQIVVKHCRDNNIKLGDIDVNQVVIVSAEVWRNQYGCSGLDEAPLRIFAYKNPVLPVRLQIHFGFVIPSSALQGNFALVSTDNYHSVYDCHDYDGDDITTGKASLIDGAMRELLFRQSLPVLADIRIPAKDLIGLTYSNIKYTATNNLDSAVGRAESFMSQIFDLATTGAIKMVKDEDGEEEYTMLVDESINLEEWCVKCTKLVQGAIDSLKKIVEMDGDHTIEGKSISERYGAKIMSVRQFLKSIHQMVHLPGQKGIEKLVREVQLLNDILEGKTLFSGPVEAFLENYEPLDERKWMIKGYAWAQSYHKYVEVVHEEELRMLVHTASQAGDFHEVVEELDCDLIIEAMRKAEADTKFNGRLLGFTRSYDQVQKRRRSVVSKINVSLTEAESEELRQKRRTLDSVQAWNMMSVTAIVAKHSDKTEESVIGHWLWVATKIHPVLWFRVAPEGVIELLSKYYAKLREEGRIYRG